MKRRKKLLVILGVVLVLLILTVTVRGLLRRPADRPTPPPVFVERPTAAVDPAVAQAAAAKAPGDAASQKKLGDAMLAKRRFDEAATAYRASVASAPNQPLFVDNIP